MKLGLQVIPCRAYRLSYVSRRDILPRFTRFRRLAGYSHTKQADWSKHLKHIDHY